MIPIWVETWLKDSSVHFLLSASLGLLGYWLTSIILSAWMRLFIRATSASSFSPGAMRFIRFISLAVSLLLALWAHSALDALLDWYRTPLGPPLGG